MLRSRLGIRQNKCSRDGGVFSTTNDLYPTEVRVVEDDSVVEDVEFQEYLCEAFDVPECEVKVADE